MCTTYEQYVWPEAHRSHKWNIYWIQLIEFNLNRNPVFGYWVAFRTCGSPLTPFSLLFMLSGVFSTSIGWMSHTDDGRLLFNKITHSVASISYGNTVTHHHWESQMKVSRKRTSTTKTIQISVATIMSSNPAQTINQSQRQSSSGKSTSYGTLLQMDLVARIWFVFYYDLWLLKAIFGFNWREPSDYKN